MLAAYDSPSYRGEHVPRPDYGQQTAGPYGVGACHHGDRARQPRRHSPRAVVGQGRDDLAQAVGAVAEPRDRGRSMRLKEQRIEQFGEQIFAVGDGQIPQWRKIRRKSSWLDNCPKNFENERNRLGRVEGITFPRLHAFERGDRTFSGDATQWVVVIRRDLSQKPHIGVVSPGGNHVREVAHPSSPLHR
jgi:hypothetical protein